MKQRLRVKRCGKLSELQETAGILKPLLNGLKIGMTLREVAEKVGRPYEDDEDCRMIDGMPGIAIETSEWKRKYSESFGDFDPDAVVTDIFVIPTKEEG